MICVGDNYDVVMFICQAFLALTATMLLLSAPSASACPSLCARDGNWCVAGCSKYDGAIKRKCHAKCGHLYHACCRLFSG